jgi:predicted RNase H-like HicB family nuclease
MTYTVMYQRADDGTIWAYSPDLPGVTGAGDSIEEATESLKAGAEAWIEVALERGEPIPVAATFATGEITVNAA